MEMYMPRYIFSQDWGKHDRSMNCQLERLDAR